MAGCGYLEKGDKLQLTGFEAFSVLEGTTRIDRNPQTGKISARKVVKLSKVVS